MNHNRHIELQQFRHLYPFESNFLDVNGLAYHFIDEGSGDPLVMVHGNPTWSFYYRVLIQGLSDRFRTIAPDHIGCGLSDKPDLRRYDFRLKSRVDDLEKLMQRLALNQRVTLILHDWGGMIGMAYALRNPDSISRIVLMNTAAFFPPGGRRLPLRLRLIRNIRPLATPAVLGLNLFSYAALYMASHKGLAKDVKSGLTAPYNNWNNRLATLKFVQDIPLKKSDPSYDLVCKVQENLDHFSKIPMLICWGTHDFVFNDTYLNEWRRRFPAAEIHTFADAGHYVLEDKPARIQTLIRGFLDRHPL
jgi:cis-3-alkyl-4-acyloxetan-2-one decarboxylase